MCASRRCTPGGDAGPELPFYTWPYVEGLRLDEAMNDLALLVTGLYGKPLPTRTAPRSGWWCPGSTASRASSAIVKIDLVERQPTSLWMAAGAGRVRLLRQRQPGRAPPALVAVDRAPHRRAAPAPDAAVQRLRRAGERPLRGHGPAPELLMAAPAVPRRRRPRPPQPPRPRREHPPPRYLRQSDPVAVAARRGAGGRRAGWPRCAGCACSPTPSAPSRSCSCCGTAGGAG